MKKFTFTIETLNDNGSGMTYKTKEEFLKEIGLMIDDCIKNGGTYFDVQVDSDVSCFYQMDEKHIAHNIKWDTDGDIELFKTLPQEIEIPDWVWEEYEDGYDEAISEYVSDVTGFCHYGFEIRTENIKEEKIMTNITIYDCIQLGDTFHNDNGTDYIILAFNKEADIALLLNPKNKFTPYVGANGLRNGHWCHGHYFQTINGASEWYNSIIDGTY